MATLKSTLLLITCLLLSFNPSLCHSKTALASWYDTGSGVVTASGERFTARELTAAHRKLPFGSKVKITYEGKSIIVRINDRGPYRKGRTFDLSKHAADRLGIKGLAKVNYSVLSRNIK